MKVGVKDDQYDAATPVAMTRAPSIVRATQYPIQTILRVKGANMQNFLTHRKTAVASPKARLSTTKTDEADWSSTTAGSTRKPRNTERKLKRDNMKKLNSLAEKGSFRMLWSLTKMRIALEAINEEPVLDHPAEVIEEPKRPRPSKITSMPETLELPLNHTKPVTSMVSPVFVIRHGKAHREGFLTKKSIRTKLSLGYLDD